MVTPTLAAEWAGPEVGALVAAIIALTLSASSIGWQVVSWFRSGARLRVRVEVAARLGLPRHAGRWLLAIRAANAGRGNTVISEVGFRLPTGETLIAQQSDHEDNVSLPKTIEPGGILLYKIPGGRVSREVLDLVVTEPTELKPYVLTGHGRELGKWIRSAVHLVEQQIESIRPWWTPAPRMRGVPPEPVPGLGARRPGDKLPPW